MYTLSDFQNPLRYDGQVLLCPMDSKDSNKFSTSYGLVGIYYKDKGAKGINQKGDQPMGGYEADAICQSMGFTGAYPGSAVTRNVSNFTPNPNCFVSLQLIIITFLDFIILSVFHHSFKTSLQVST